jgi:hypothetical protein
MPVNPTGTAMEEVSVMAAVVTKPAVVAATVVVIAAVVIAAAVMIAATVVAAAVAVTAAVVTTATAVMTAAATAAVMTALRLCRRIGRAHHQAGYARGGETIDSKQGACRCQVRHEFRCSSPSIPDHFISSLAPVTLAPQESAPTAKYSHNDPTLYAR